MGAIWLHRLPEFFDRWGVPYSLTPGWETRARTSGGFSAIRGVQVHHDASSPKGSLASTVKYATVTSPVAPIGNGTITRTADGPKVVLWAAGASNTAGKGGPRLSTSRGLIPLDSANSMTVAFEAANNGVTERWADDMLDVYVDAVCATLDWANTHTPGPALSPGDVFAHFEWAPGRKIDPAGPSRFNGNTPRARFNMDQFRGEVFMRMLGGARPRSAPVVEVAPEPAPVAPPLPPATPCPLPGVMSTGATGPDVSLLQSVLASNNWYPYRVDGSYGPRTTQAVQACQRWLTFVGLYAGPIHGVFDDATRNALCAAL